VRCSNKQCRLEYAHSGPCDEEPRRKHFIIGSRSPYSFLQVGPYNGRVILRHVIWYVCANGDWQMELSVVGADNQSVGLGYTKRYKNKRELAKEINRIAGFDFMLPY